MTSNRSGKACCVIPQEMNTFAKQNNIQLLPQPPKRMPDNQPTLESKLPHRGDIIRVFAGSNSFERGQRRDGYIWHKHSKYVSVGSDMSHDIGMIKVDRPFDRIFDNQFQISPICLPERDWVNTYRMDATIFGWGDMEDNHDAQVLQTTQVNLKQNYLCPSKLFCSSYFPKDRPRICVGDSGGPLVVYDQRSIFRKAILIGIAAGVKHKNRSSTDCSHKNILENYWVAVPKFIDWIIETIDEKSKHFY